MTDYTWDHRNRVTSVSELDELGGNVTKEVDYRYDVNNRLVGKILDPDGEGEEEATEEYYAYDQTPFSTRENASQMLFRFAGSEVSDLKDRYLWAPVVDLLLSDEKLTGPSTPGDIYWTLGDNLNTVRDIARYDPQTDTTTIVNHRVFDAFGRLTSETNSAVDLLFAFTGRLFDDSTGLQNNLHRWYDPTVGRWLSEDPIGFKAGDQNLYRYVANRPTYATDPTGLWGADVHAQLTALLAAYAGFDREAYQIGAACYAPDVDGRSADRAFGYYSGGLVAYKNGQLSFLGLCLRFDGLLRAAEWHYPKSADGEVHANSAEARAKMKAGYDAGDLMAFSQGLHTLQDSWSHQGTPSPVPDPFGTYVPLVGHPRGGKWVQKDPRSPSWWSSRPLQLQGPNNSTIYVVYIPPLGAGGYFERYSGLRAATSASADDATYWPADVRAAAMETYRALLDFRNRWSARLRPMYAAASEKVVEAYLMARFPGGNLG